MGKMGSFDFSEIVKFRDNLQAMHKAFPDFMGQCVTELANRLLAKTVPRTPVDDGKLRRGWTIGQVTLTSAGAEIEVFNSVDYSAYVEYGHRAPNHRGLAEGRFMMTISVQELERELPAIIEHKMQRFLERFLR